MTVVLNTKKTLKKDVSLSSVLVDTFASYRKVDPRTLELSCLPESLSEHGDDWFNKAKAAVSEVAKANNLVIGSWVETENSNGNPALHVEFASEFANNNGTFCSEVKDTLNSMSTPDNPYNVLDVRCIEGDQFGGVLVIIYDTEKYKDPISLTNAVSALRANLKSIMRTHYRISTLSISPTKAPTDSQDALHVLY